MTVANAQHQFPEERVEVDCPGDNDSDKEPPIIGDMFSVVGALGSSG